MNLKAIKNLLVSVSLIFLVSSAISCSVENGSAHKESDNVADKPLPTIDTTAVNIFRAYDRNELAADQEYRGRKIRVAGVVSSISSTYDNTAQVSLETENQFMSVKTSGDREFDAKAARLYKGQSIRMTCIGAGETMGMPVLVNCVLP